MRLIIEGWRYLAHSYGAVDRGLCMELCGRNGVELFHRDMPYIDAGIRNQPGTLGDEALEQRLAKIATATADQQADATLRLFVPLNLEPAPGGRTLVFTTAEFTMHDPHQIARSSLAAMNGRRDLALLTPSQWSRASLIRTGADPAKVIVLPHGVDTNVFAPLTAEKRAQLRKRLGWDDAFVFLSVGALTVNKGITDLLAAMAALSDEYPSAKVVIKGLDRLYKSSASLQTCMAQLTPEQRRKIEGRVIYMGQTLDEAGTAELFQAADAYVAPYRAEGFNLPVLEAAACGLPVICTAGGPTDEFTDERFALPIASQLRPAEQMKDIPGAWQLVPDLEHLIGQMRRIITDHEFRKTSRSAGPEIVKGAYTWKHITDRLLAVLSDDRLPAWLPQPVRAAVMPHPHFDKTAATLAAEAHEARRNGDRALVRQRCQQLLRQSPMHADALYLLGLLAVEDRQPQEGLVYLLATATQQPQSAMLHLALADAYNQLRCNDEAVDCFRIAIALDPNLATAHNGLGEVLLDRGQQSAAEECFRQAIALRGDYARAWLNLGRALHFQNDLTGARAAVEKALEIKDDYSTAHNALGAVLLAQGDLTGAAPCFQRAIKLQVDYPEAHCNLGSTLLARGDPMSAAKEFQEAIRLRPTYARAHAQLAAALFDLGQLAASVPIWQNAAKLNPSDPALLVRLGEVQRLLGNLEQAETALEAASRLRGDDTNTLAARFYLRCEMCQWQTYEEDLTALWSAAQREMAAGRPAGVHPMYALSLPWTPQQQLEIASAYSRAMVRSAPPLPHPPQANRIKIGYLSRDFYDHPIAHQMQSIFGLHDRKQFEVHAYSFGPDDRSPYRQRIQRECEHFHDIEKLSIGASIEQIRADGIHILVDLMGYSGLSRAAVLAARSAPIQVNWLGYAATTGAAFMDYIIGDPVITPREHADDFSEKIVRLPGSYMPTDDQQEIGQDMKRADQGLPKDAVVFCCFHNSHKITPQMFDVWMNILDRVSGSVLWMSVRNAVPQANLRRAAKARGIDPGRLIFANHVASKAQHLARLRLADLLLDARPYNAHATACDALWAGLPVLTCPEATFASRVGASLLTAMGVPELIAGDLETYQPSAIELAQDRAALADIRRKIDAQRQNGSLFDTAWFVKNLEQAYLKMWELHTSGQAPAAIDVG